jgi:hypothetical protein
MMDCIQLADLNKPGTNAFHDFSTGFQALTPMSLPFEEIAWMERVGPQLE